MSSVLILSLIMIVVSGLIAYVGDLIGRRMGRKRLSLFGLRPKHTAIVISILAGAIIAAITLTATFIVNREVRELLFTPLSKVKSELVKSRLDLDKAHNQTAMAESKLHARTADLTVAEEKLALADTKLIKLNGQRENAVAKLQQITVQLRKKNDEYNAAQLMLINAKSELGEKRQGLLTAQNRLIDITRKKSNLEEKRMALEQQVIELGDQITLLSKLASGTFSPPSIIAGQEILTGRFDTRKDNLRTEVAAFLSASADVVRQSSPQLSQGSEPIIYLDSKDNKPIRLTEEEATRIITAKISAMKSNMVILHMVSINNVPANGQAIVALNSPGMLYPDEVIYKKGEEITRITIKDKNNTASAMEIIVNDLLGKSVPNELRKKQLVAVNHRFINRKIAIDNTESYVSWNILLSAAEQAAAIKGDAVAIVRSKGETTRYSPLDIIIDIIPFDQSSKSP